MDRRRSVGRTLQLVILLSTALVSPLWAEMYTQLDIIGFSSAGDHLAYEISGWDSQSKRAFSLLGRQQVDKRSGRKWSEAYPALTNRGKPGKYTNWLSPQSAPTMLPPYNGGAAKSRLIQVLEKKHEGVKLSGEEMDKIACWIDLLVPYCGDYMEAHAWGESGERRYRHFLDKRRRMQRLEYKNTEELIASPPHSQAVPKD